MFILANLAITVTQVDVYPVIGCFARHIFVECHTHHNHCFGWERGQLRKIPTACPTARSLWVSFFLNFREIRESAEEEE